MRAVRLSVTCGERTSPEYCLDHSRDGSMIIEPVIDRILWNQWRDYDRRHARTILFEREAVLVVFVVWL